MLLPHQYRLCWNIHPPHPSYPTHHISGYPYLMAYQMDNYPVVSAFAYFMYFQHFLHFRYLRISSHKPISLPNVSSAYLRCCCLLLLSPPPPLLPLICISLASYWLVNIPAAICLTLTFATSLYIKTSRCALYLSNN